MTVYIQQKKSNIDKISDEIKGYPIYLSVRIKENKTTISFTKSKTNYLYAISDEDFDCPFSVLKNKDETEDITKKITETKRQKTDKKTKQSNLFNFMKK
ncbi:hypothetical protein BDAP_000245 [Binucleata daphniae]